MGCSPQRYIANNGNELFSSTLTPSSVKPIDDHVIEIPVSRDGTGAVVLEGSYQGDDQATYDVEIVDNDPENPVVSAVVATGQGSGTLTDITVLGAAQEFTVELQNEGIPIVAAGVNFEGVRIVARTPGAAGNDLALEIDQAGLVFTAQAFSLLDDLPAGSGGPDNGLIGAAYDWDTKAIGLDNIIPASAHRVSFGEDTTNIYLAYKEFANGEWNYHFVPAIRETVPRGTIVKFVTGSRAVYVTDGTSPPLETFTGIITVYDLLHAIKTESTYLDVVGVVAYDRSPTGQASRELLLRTDAHCGLSTGTGSKYATGFVNCSAGANAATELVTAECVAVSPKDHPEASVGAERWKLKGTVSGDLGIIVTGEQFTHPSGYFSVTVPTKLPDNFQNHVGRFSVVAINYEPRGVDDNGDPIEPPPICPVALTLGSEAVDQTITLTWTKRPSGDCSCTKLPIPKLNAFCLGLTETEGGDLPYQADTIGRMTDLWEYAAAVMRANTTTTSITSSGPANETDAGTTAAFIDNPEGIVNQIDQAKLAAQYGPGNTYVPPVVSQGTRIVPDSFWDICRSFESAVIALDPVADSGLRAAGMAAWDSALTELQTDVPDDAPTPSLGLDDNVYNSLLAWVLASAGIPSSGKTEADSITSGDGCWRDEGGDYWSVVGSDKGGYAPAFNNSPYYSSRVSTDGKHYFSTREFGFQINIKCPGGLEYGDEIILAIGDAGYAATYQIGDLLSVPIIAGQNLQLAGGQDGSGSLVWYVTGSVVGPLPQFTYDPDSPTPYLATGELEFTYTPGGIPNRKGDKFTFSVEGGHYRWRKDGGAWVEDSPLPSISANPVAFDSGLTIRFVAGAAPSFEPGDLFSFRALQPWAVSNVKKPGPEKWRWTDETTATLDADRGQVVDVHALLIARHTLPESAVIVFEGGDAAPNEWTESIPWREGVIYVEFDTPHTARYMRLSVTGADDDAIGWAWAGVPMTTELQADVQIHPTFRIETGGTAGLDQGGRYLAQSESGSISWSDVALADPDVEKIIAMAKWAKRNHDEPIALVPNVERSDEAYLVQLGVDRLAFEELTGLNATPNLRDRRYALELPVTGIWRA